MTDNAIARRKYAVPPYEPGFTHDQVQQGTPEEVYEDFMQKYGHLHPRAQRQLWDDYLLLERSRDLRQHYKPNIAPYDDKGIKVDEKYDFGVENDADLADYAVWLKSPRRGMGPYPGRGKW